MKGKLMIHYSISFILSCMFIVLINIWFMMNNIYKEGALYNYYPEEIISSVEKNIYVEDNKIKVSDAGLELLKNNNMGVQILDDSSREIFDYNKPKSAPEKYSSVSLVDMYRSEEETLFLEEINIENSTYTYLLFFDSSKVKRITYSYDVALVEKAHKFPILIIINIILLLLISFLYTKRITKPINRIMNRIFNLSNEDYSIDKLKPGIYYKVEQSLNQLADRLDNNEKERQKLEKMREEWISNISHDIKTPLTSIIGSAEIMEDTNYELSNKTRIKCCNTIINKSEYIKRLVEDLNLSARLNNNNLVLKKKKVNIVSLVRHIIIDIINDEKYNYSNINFNYSHDDIFIDLEEGLINRVFINIIINSFVHNDFNVKVNINIQKINENKVEITISDNGKGVSEEELKNIFRRYYRGTNTKKKIEGSGLGMAIAHDIIKVHNGDIEAMSKLNQGLMIKIVL